MPTSVLRSMIIVIGVIRKGLHLAVIVIVVMRGAQTQIKYLKAMAQSWKTGLEELGSVPIVAGAILIVIGRRHLIDIQMLEMVMPE